jgi:hypothetical protein
MAAVARAYKARSLADFQAALGAHGAQLGDDPIVQRHLAALYDTLLEGNLARLIEPYSRVEIAHLAHLIQLPHALVLNKLSQVWLLAGVSLCSCLALPKSAVMSMHQPEHAKFRWSPCLAVPIVLLLLGQQDPGGLWTGFCVG